MANENRGALLEANFPQTIVSILEGYAEPIDPANTSPLPLSVPDLRIVKTAVGVLLNLSVGFEPVQTRLISLEAALTILKLSIAIYPPGSWLHETHQPSEELNDPETALILESWSLRSGLASWALRAISELREDEEEQSRHLPPRQFFTIDALPYLVRPLQAFIPPYPSLPPLFANPSSRRNLVQTDFEVLEEACGLLESLALDVEDVRLSLARGHAVPAEHGGVTCLTDMLTFVDRGDYPPYWSSSSSSSSTSSSPDPEHAAKEKAFDICKAAVIKAIVEVAGEEKNTDVLWDDSEAAEGKPGGEFVQKMVQWIRTHKTLSETNRDDLIICATISLGNLVRRETHAAAIVNPPISLGPDLASLLAPKIDIKVKHGVLGLLKHLAQSPANRPILGKAGIIQRLASSGVWSDKADMVEIVQVSAIGVAKHLCSNNVENSFALVLPESSQPPESTALQQTLVLVRRSDSIAVKSEGTRVLVNAIKSLWSPDALSSKDPTFVQKRKDAINVVANQVCAAALAQLIGRSKKYPLLINEGVVALSLLSTHANGGQIVLDALMNPLPSEVNARGGPPPVSAGGPLAGNSVEASPVVGPRRALDMIVSVLRAPPVLIQGVTVHTADIPVEVRANTCALVGHLGRKGVVPEDRAKDVEILKESTRELLEIAAKERTHAGSAAKRALEAWGPLDG
ncbi:unnamed protein product [Somion occarium]|uniref:Uncharacterized protein n=1 Tax=Somion occarium TaxID=3059160 RepID=A0ABP1DAJ1_9APHY